MPAVEHDVMELGHVAILISRAGLVVPARCPRWVSMRRASMFERFDDSARRVIVLAQDEARKLDHHFIGTEHLLLALIREGQGVAATALTSLGAGYDAVLARVNASLGRGTAPTPSHLPFTEAIK